jgi:TrmH family RNA methyltransferase
LSQRVYVSQIQKYYILISKSQIKLITSLQQNKYRNKTGLFVAEGPKIIKDLLKEGLEVHSLFSSTSFNDLGDFWSEELSGFSESKVLISQIELKKISALKTANTMLAVFHIPKKKEIPRNGLLLVLDGIRDPGNLGTIIRLCDWFGVTHLICSQDTVDCYNSKVVQATMGSIARVTVSYVDLEVHLQHTDLPIYAAVMDGESIYTETLSQDAILVMGNEASGISPNITSLIQRKITIPSFSKKDTAESLNVATATGILLSEFRRNESE